MTAACKLILPVPPPLPLQQKVSGEDFCEILFMAFYSMPKCLFGKESCAICGRKACHSVRLGPCRPASLTECWGPLDGARM